MLDTSTLKLVILEWTIATGTPSSPTFSKYYQTTTAFGTNAALAMAKLPGSSTLYTMGHESAAPSGNTYNKYHVFMNVGALDGSKDTCLQPAGETALATGSQFMEYTTLSSAPLSTTGFASTPTVTTGSVNFHEISYSLSSVNSLTSTLSVCSSSQVGTVSAPSTSTYTCAVTVGSSDTLTLNAFTHTRCTLVVADWSFTTDASPAWLTTASTSNTGEVNFVSAPTLASEVGTHTVVVTGTYGGTSAT